MTYFNGTTITDTTPTSVQLQVNLNFTAPPVGTQSLAFTLGLVSTPNTGDAMQNADYVYFPSSYSGSTFMINGTTYTLRITGFENVQGDAGFLGSGGGLYFHVEEQGTASAELFGEVTTNLTGTPEPSTLLIGIVSGGGMLVMARRRRVRTS